MVDGDFFEFLSHHNFGEEYRQLTEENIKEAFDKINVEIPLIYCKSDHLLEFLIKSKNINKKFILISHNSDLGFEFANENKLIRQFVNLENHIHGGKFDIFNNENILHWFGQNINILDEKITSLPIGLERKRWSGGSKHDFLSKLDLSKFNKETLLYVNHQNWTNEGARGGLQSIYGKYDWAKVESNKPYNDYIESMMKSKYILSPRGNGIDCHRTWEAITAGCIPIVQDIQFNRNVYGDMPVLIVENLKDLTENFLNEKYDEIRQKSREKLNPEYWTNLINSKRQEFI